MSIRNLLSTFLIKKNLLIGLFTYFVIANANLLLGFWPKLFLFVRGSFSYQLLLTFLVTAFIHFWGTQKSKFTKVRELLSDANKQYFPFLRTLVLKTAGAGIIVLFFFFFYNTRKQRVVNERKLTVYFTDTIKVKRGADADLLAVQEIYYIDTTKVKQPWQLYYLTSNGYTPLESSEVIPTIESVSFSITTPSHFSALRMDPGNLRITQIFGIKKLELKEKGNLITCLLYTSPSPRD